MGSNEWTEKEDEQLAQLILETVLSGGSVLSACREYDRRTHGRHSAKSCRREWYYILSRYLEKYREEKAIKRSRKHPVSQVQQLLLFDLDD